MVVGATESMRTVAVRAVSTLPAAWTALQLIVVRPWTTIVTGGVGSQVPPLRECSMREMPEPSVAESTGKTSSACQSASTPICVDTVGLVSILTVKNADADVLPTPSAARYF